MLFSCHLGCFGDSFLAPLSRYIKNPSTAFAKSVKMLRATHRWCITGTPIQNSLEGLFTSTFAIWLSCLHVAWSLLALPDLFSLFQFLRHDPYDQKSSFRSAFVPPKGPKLTRLQTTLTAICLRRTKKGKIDGKPILELPEREMDEREELFSPEEHDYYKAIETASQVRLSVAYFRSRRLGDDERLSKTLTSALQQLKFSMFVKAGTVTKNYASALLLLLRLRQCCNHPLLTQLTEDGEAVSAETEALPAADGSGALLNEDGSLPEVQLDSKSKKKKKKAKAEANPAAKIIPAAVLSRILVEGVNTECPICLDIVTRFGSVITPCGHAFCKVCFEKYTNDKGDAGCVVDCPMCRKPITAGKIVSAQHVRWPPSCLLRRERQNQPRAPQVLPAADSLDMSDSDGDDDAAGPAQGDETARFEKMSAKNKIKFLAKKAKESMARFQGTMAVSTKIAKLLAILEVEIAEDPRVKILIFSQWTSMLDLVEPVLDKKL